MQKTAWGLDFDLFFQPLPVNQCRFTLDYAQNCQKPNKCTSVRVRLFAGDINQKVLHQFGNVFLPLIGIWLRMNWLSFGEHSFTGRGRQFGTSDQNRLPNISKNLSASLK